MWNFIEFIYTTARHLRRVSHIYVLRHAKNRFGRIAVPQKVTWSVSPKKKMKITGVNNEETDGSMQNL